MTRNIAVIGSGAVACYGHLPALVQNKHWHLKAIVDTNEKQLAYAADKFPAEHHFNTVDALWSLEDLDAVVIATHLDSHHELALRAFERGCHVFCEKPMAPTLEQCQAMILAAEKSGKLLAINFNTRSQEIYRVMRDLVHAGLLGPIAVARFAYLWSAHQWQPPQRMASFMAHGGPIIDSGVHFFDGVRLLTGREFTQIHAHGAFVTGDKHPQHVIATCRLEGGAVALVEAGWLYTRNTKETDAIYHVELIGEHGAIRANLVDMTLHIHTADGSEQRHITDKGKDFDWIYDTLAQSIDAGRLIGLASGHDGMKATQAAFTALRSTHGEASASC